MRLLKGLILSLLGSEAICQSLVPLNCMRTTPLQGRETSDSFSDVDPIVDGVKKSMRLYAIQHCEELNRMIGIRVFVADTEDISARTRLGTHGITDREGTCQSSTLPSQVITAGRIYSKEYTLVEDETPVEMISGIQLTYIEPETNGERTVSFGELRGQSVSTKFDTDKTPLLGVYGTQDENGFTSMGWVYYDIECKTV